MTDKERLEAITKYFKKSTRAFGLSIGMKNAQTLYDILNGKHGISKDLADKISAKYLNINKSWLLTGDGSMLKEDTNTQVSTTSSSSSDEVSQTQLDIMVQALDRLTKSEANNSENVKELIAQGRQQTDNITRLIDLLCQKGVDVNDLVDKEKGGLKSSGNSEKNTASDVDAANAG